MYDFNLTIFQELERNLVLVSGIQDMELIALELVAPELVAQEQVAQELLALDLGLHRFLILYFLCNFSSN